MALGKRKVLIYYGFIITLNFNNSVNLPGHTGACQIAWVDSNNKIIFYYYFMVSNMNTDNLPQFLSEDLEALLIRSCQVFSQHPSKQGKCQNSISNELTKDVIKMEQTELTPR